MADVHDTAARMVAAVRAILAEFDWVSDEHSHALEAIRVIMDGGQAPAPGVTLTADQRQQIDRARMVLIWDEEGIAGASASNMETASYAIAYGRARGIITALLAVIDELIGGES